MLTSGQDEEFSLYQAYEDFQRDQKLLSKRKNSFIDLLTPENGIPSDDLFDFQIDSLYLNWQLPELNTQPSESEPLELNFEGLFDIKTSIKRQNHISNEKIPHPVKQLTNHLVGTLTIAQRKQKIAKYLEKRKRRTWQKRIYYDCRKRVAENRLRVKGRFVTKDQAILILGPDHEAVKSLN